MKAEGMQIEQTSLPNNGVGEPGTLMRQAMRHPLRPQSKSRQKAYVRPTGAI